MAVSLAPEAHIQFSDATGAPLASGKVFTFAAGTSTPLATFTDSTGGTPNANPVILDAGGFANIWLTNNVGYKFQVQNAAGSTLWTVDNILNTVFVGVSPQKQIFTAGGTFTIPAGVTSAKVTVIGAGGGGGGSNGANAGMGGGSGGWSEKWLSALTPGNTLTVTVGTGGTGVSAATGNAGTASSVASGTQVISTITANGGSGGLANSAAVVGGGPGGTVGSGGDLNFAGSSAPGFVIATLGGAGAPSVFGGYGNTASSSAGVSATVAGAGGSGAQGTGPFAGGAGKDGIIIFEWVA